jgi:Ser-tRNA(Ala) deacylase AlaX
MEEFPDNPDEVANKMDGKFTLKDAQRIAKELKIDFDKEEFTIEEFLEGLNTELEHGSHDQETNITNDDPIKTGKIAWAHLKELSDYYTRLKKMEAAAGN